MNSKIEWLKKIGYLLFVLLIIFGGVVVTTLPENYKIKKYREELIENRKTIKAYVYVRSPKHRTIKYHFKIDDIEYYGFSRYTRWQLYPESGDSILIYYKEDDPSVNLWAGMFEKNK